MSSNEIVSKLFPDAQCLDPVTEAKNWQRHLEDIERERQRNTRRALQAAAIHGANSATEVAAEPVPLAGEAVSLQAS